MAGFGDDVSMSDFRPANHGMGEEKDHQHDHDGGTSPGGHTSDASVLNVPSREQQGFGGGGFGNGIPTPARDQVSCAWNLGLCRPWVWLAG